MEASLMAQTVKNLIAMRETQVQSLGQEDLLEKGITPTPVFLPGEFHGERRLEDCSPQGCRVSHNWVTKYSKYSNYTDLLLVHLMSNLHLLLPYPVRLSRFMRRFAWSTELAKKKNGNSLHTLFLPLVSASSYDWCQTPAGLKWDVAPRAMPGSGED